MLREGSASNMLRCIAGQLVVNTCDHVWGDSLNVSKLESGSAETIENCLDMGTQSWVKGQMEVVWRFSDLRFGARWAMSSPLDF